MRPLTAMQNVYFRVAQTSGNLHFVITVPSHFFLIPLKIMAAKFEIDRSTLNRAQSSVSNLVIPYK